MLENVTVFDFETTGLDPEKDRVIEMAAIRVVYGKVISEFSTIVKFDGILSPKITEITGIIQSDLEAGLTETASFKYLSHFIGDSLIVAHNAAFDMAFLHYGLMRIGRTFENPFIDTLTISRDRHYYPHKLENMCELYEIPLDGAHRALNDVHGCWQLLKAMHKEKVVTEWINKLGYMNKYGAPKWSPGHAELFGTNNKYEPRESTS